MNPNNNPNAQAAQSMEQIPPEIHTFLENIVQDANMTNLDDVTKEEMIKEIYARLDQYIASTIISHLAAEDVDAFIKMNEEKKSQVQIQQFLTEKIPNTQQVMTQAFMDFREMYLGNVSGAKNAPTENTNQGNST